MKRSFFFILMSVIAMALFSQSIAKPTAELTQFQIKAISLRDVTFQFELTVSNPYPLGLSFSGMTLDFSVEGSKVFSAANQGGFSVPAKGKKSNQFTVQLAYEDIYKLVKNYSEKEWLNTVINGKLTIPLPKVPGVPADISFNYKLEKKIPAIKPEVAITGFTVTPPTAAEVSAALVKAGKKADPDKARGAIADVLAGKKPAAPVIDPAELDLPLKVSFTIQIRNDARGPINFNALNYELFINGESLVVGESSSISQKGQEVLITVANTFSTKRLTASVKRLFTDKKGSFRVKGSTSIKLPDEISSKPIPLGFDEKGAFTLK
ncbi:LEA type 2 family protein [Gracilinema caldarium]|uniref:Water Stress and Hypersensitive response domain-containing protein n=1 Tax=Gracilinema caldarium (strain ATCC 51460 / DSM 7334 / H1) TaxID=744872 RepID=F8F0A2_GRAC1|nr:LEA type 2 family protein [Gracilinema caldarium]AEJ18966.1 Water Stress and Hypersensitive response domain-containing protein [Gracilinema caldarium DSM 7334]